MATLHHAANLKSALVDADEVTGGDSASSFGIIRTTWTNVKAFLKTYFDGLYLALAGGTMTGTLTTRTGTATAGTAPLNIPVASALLTAAVQGAVESD